MNTIAAVTTTPTTVADMVAQANSTVQSISADALQTLRQHQPDLLVIDVREPDEYAGGHLPGAVLVPRGKLEFLADPSSSYRHAEMRPERPVAVYCHLGLRGLLAAATLQQLGYRHVVNLDGGIDAWISSGHDVERG